MRYLIAGFHFAVVGAGGFFDDILVHHFRRHYFQMGLMLHMEFAGLLSTSSRITGAVSGLAAGEREDGEPMERAERKFRDTMIQIERDFLRFVHLFHFTGLSNQIQPNELFLKWRHALGVDRIFADLEKEIETATQFLLSIEQREETLASSRLAAVATIGVVLGLAFTFLGMNLLVDKDVLGLATPSGTPGTINGLLAKHLMWVLGVVAAFSLSGWLLSRWLQAGERPDRWGGRIQKVLRNIFLSAAVLCGGIALWVWPG